MRSIIYLYFLLLFVFVSKHSYGQCRAPLSTTPTTCKGTAYGGGANFSGNTYINNTIPGSPGTFAGFTKHTTSAGGNQFSPTGIPPYDTLFICGNSKIEIVSTVLSVVVIEPGSELMITSTNFSRTQVYNYGTFLINSGSGSFAINNSAEIVNASYNSVIYAMGNSIAVTGPLVNYGLIRDVDALSTNNSASYICLGGSSVIKANSISNINSGDGLRGNTAAPNSGCIQVTGAQTGSCWSNNSNPSGANTRICSSTPYSGSTNCGGSLPDYYGNVQTGCSTCSSPLPIALVYFDVTKSKEGVKLEWLSSAQWNSDYFIVERSSDGVHWIQVNVVQAHGTNKELKNYSTIDYSPAIGDNYYRLSEVDLKGKKTIYSVEYVEFESNFSGFTVQPNPSHGDLTITVFGDAPNYQLELIDIAGKTVAKPHLQPGKNHLEHILPIAGVYIAKLKVGKNYFTQKVVVK